MKQSLKRWLCIAATLTLTLASLPQESLSLLQQEMLTASAFSRSGKCGENAKWTLDSNGTLEITGKGEVNQLYLEKNQENWLYLYSIDVKKIIINEGITALGEKDNTGAFEMFTYLDTVSLPSTLKTIGKSAFSECKNLKEINMPDSVESIGEGAFGNTALTSITIPPKIKTIGKWAFYGNDLLTDVIISDGVQALGDDLFCDCYGIRELEFPASVQKIGRLFDGGIGVTNVTVHNPKCELSDYFAGSYVKKIFGYHNSTAEEYAISHKIDFFCLDSEMCGPSLSWNYNETSHTLTITGSGPMNEYDDGHTPWESYIDQIENIVLPDALESISSGAFAKTPIQKITIPEKVTIIKANTFADCHNLVTVKLPSRLYEIADNAFIRCTSLSEIKIPGYVHVIGKKAFFGCKALSTFSLPSSVMEIGENVFSDCPEMQLISISNPDCIMPKVLVYNNMDSKGNPYYTGAISGYIDSTAHKYANEHELRFIDIAPSSGLCGTNLKWTYNDATCTLTITGSGRMNDYKGGMTPWRHLRYNIDRIELPDTLDTICPYAFIDTNIQEIIIPASVTTVGMGAFVNCLNLSSVTICEGVLELQADVFYDCSSIENIVIPASVESVDNGLLCYCSKLQSVTFLNKNCKFLNDMNNICNREHNGEPIYSGVIRGYKGSTAEAFAKKWNYTFEDLYEIPVSGQCGTNLSWKFEESSHELIITGTGDMDDFTKKTAPWNAHRSNINFISLPEGLTSIGNYAFYDSAIRNINIPDSVNRIGTFAFSGIAKLSEIQLPDSVTEIGAGAFSMCPSLKIVKLSAGLRTLADTTFFLCSFTEIIIPESVTDIGDTFILCSLLKDTYIMNPDCQISSSSDINYFGTIHGYAGSKAEEYAQNYNRTFEAFSTKLLLDANNGSGTVEDTVINLGTEYALPECTFTAPVPEKTFKGWKIGDVVYQPNDKISVTSFEDLTAVALWDYSLCTVTFEPNGGSGESIEPLNAIIGSTVYLPRCTFTAPDNLVFFGWVFKDDPTETFYQPGDALKPENDMTFMAFWGDPDDPRRPIRKIRLGNFDKEDVIDSKDAMILSRYVSGWEGIDIDSTTADIDGDGEISIRDAMILTRYVNGWDGYDQYFK